MNKPITVAWQEFTEALVNLVNTSGLPAFVMRQSLSQMDNALAQLEQSQLEKDTKAYNRLLEEEQPTVDADGQYNDT